MKIALCGSLNFADEMKKIEERLTAKGHEVILPASIKDFSINNSKVADEFKIDRKKYMDRKPHYTKMHFDKIVNSDAILVVNLEKHGIENYIGGNTLMEMGFAHVHDIKVYLLNPPPEIGYKDEILATMTEVINDDLTKIK